MNRPRASKDAEDFAKALEGRGAPNSDVQQLVRFAESLRETPADPSPDFVTTLRSQLMADASSVLTVAPKLVRTATARPVAHPVRRRLAAATAAVLATAGTLGIFASSAQALPGEMLYPVKRGVESIELTIHRSDAGRSSFQLAQATERLAEAQTLADKDDAQTDDLAVESLTEFADTATTGSESLFSDYTNGGNEASIDEVNSFATTSSAALSTMSSRLSPDASDVFNVAASTVTDLAAQAASLCNACRPADLTPIANMAASSARNSREKSTGREPAAPSTTSGSTGAPPALPVVTLPPSPLPEDLGDDDEVGLVPGLLDGLLDK